MCSKESGGAILAKKKSDF
ncbi:hypothetical protein EKL28_02805 [Staphylococcus aureus]|nr:hypothetical protein EKL28_02805 [Staphylococcus aureus]